MTTTYRLSLSLLLPLAAALSFAHGMRDLETQCSKQDQFTLDFDLFMELLSNHTSIARELKRAPIFGDMDPDVPAYEISGWGVHFTDTYMSKDIKRALCENNEVTFYASMYLTESQSSGTLLEISSGNGARLPVFGVYFNAAANEIMFTYRHLGVPHTVSVDQRLHTGRWRKYAFVLSGHLLEFYYDCDLVFSEIVKLPDFCTEEESFVVAFADDSEGSSDVGIGTNGIYAFFEQVGFFIGRGGLEKQCPGAGKACPSCGQYLKLVEKAYSLHAENERLRLENEALKAELDSLAGTSPSEVNSLTCEMDEEANPVVDGQFVIVDAGICYCRDGELHCDPNMVCQDNSTIIEPMECECTVDHQSCNISGECVCDEGFEYNNITDMCVDQMCRNVNGENLFVGEHSFLYVDGSDMCRVFTCMRFTETLLGAIANRLEDCRSMEATIATLGCSASTLSSIQQNISLCCQNCIPCDFHECPMNSHCVSTSDTPPECVCNTFYELHNGECVDVDECTLNPTRCGPNAMCINEMATPNTTKGFSCLCLEGFADSFFRNCRDIDECATIPRVCPPNSICTNSIGSFSCECNPGFEMTSDGQCMPACLEPCQNGGTCVAPEICQCLHGYYGPQCMEDVNECALGTHVCTHSFSECVNTIGGHFCRCKPGYEGNGTYCEDIDECDSKIHECVRKGSDDCINTEGSYICLCNLVACTGACRRGGEEYDDRESFIHPKDECSNCTCLNGEIFCHPRNCDGDCSEDVIDRCCSKCKSRDCYLKLEDRNETVIMRPESIWVDPHDPCNQRHCSSSLDISAKNLTSECPPLRCDEMFRVTPMGRCCPICLLPPCTSDKEGATLPLSNGCKQCTCQNEDWICSSIISCPSTDCAPEDVLFYENGCCPVCESDVLGATCSTLARN